MTTEEAIKVLEDRECCRECVHGAFGIDGCKDGCDECDKAFEMAYAALRAQQEAEKNEQLTLAQLREMDGEPVWMNIANGVWGLVDTDDDVVWLDRGGSVGLRALSGKAYRHKPKEG